MKEAREFRKRAGAALVAAVAVVAVVAPATVGAKGEAQRAKTKKVLVADDFFSPVNLQLTAGRKGKVVHFNWAPDNTDSHNVRLTKGPKSLTNKDKKKFKSGTGATGIVFKPKFKKKGNYSFVCTIHPDVMKLAVKVK